MAITLNDGYDFKSGFILYIIDGDGDQLEPCFAAFKRIKRIYSRNGTELNDLLADLKLLG